MIWWELPGPKAFVAAVVDDLRQAKSVFLRLPAHCPKQLSGSVRQALGTDLHWFASAVDNSAAPIDFLYQVLVPECDPSQLRSPHGLVGEPAFQGHLVWLDGLSVANWRLWSEFFLEYESASRSVHSARKTNFLLPLYGEANHLEISEGIGLSCHAWDGWLRYGDMLFYSCEFVGERPTPLETELTVALVAELACWDPELCEWLAPMLVERLTKPSKLLSEFAESRNWNVHSLDLRKQGWSKGVCQTVKDKIVFHTCFASPSELDHLIWRAETKVLMPFIEEQRQELLKMHEKHLWVPFVTKNNQLIENIFDLEIGHIEFQLVDSAGVTGAELGWVSALKRARNSLSHLEPVGQDVLTSIFQQLDE